MANATQPIPPGFHSLSPHLIVYDARAAIDFYGRAFGAEVVHVLTMPDSEQIMHAQLRIGDSPLMLGEEFRKHGGYAPTALGGTPVTIHLYVPDADAVFDRALLAGASAMMPVQEMFWGDRYGKLRDPFGHEWAIATHVRDLTQDEVVENAKKMFSQAGAGCGA